MDNALLAAPLFFAAAMLYASVGHGGASGYLAVMAGLGFAPALLRSTSLSLNLVASCIAAALFMHRSARTLNLKQVLHLLAPFALIGFPMAYWGGLLSLPGVWHKLAVGMVVLWAAAVLLRSKHLGHLSIASPIILTQPTTAALPWWVWPAGGCIGLLSGLTGVGGGIFLSPLLVLTGLVTAKQSAPVCAALIFINSLAGLLGIAQAGQLQLDKHLPLWLLAVACGAILGAFWGSRKFNAQRMRRVLAVVLAIAGLKLILEPLIKMLSMV